MTWRDVVGTVLVAVAIAATLSVVYGWAWPLIGDARAGAVALFVLSYPSCLVAQAPRRMQAAIEGKVRWSPYLVTSVVLGSATALLIIACVIFDSVPLLVGATGAMAAVWLVSTLDHLAQGAGRPVPAAT